MKSAIEKWFSKIVPNAETGCWEVKTRTKKHGNNAYPTVRVGDKMMLLHRIAYEHFNGDVPDEMCVLHACDNPSCSNPSHLFLGTRIDNAKDRNAKGRQSKGSNRPLAKISEEDIPMVHIMRSQGALQKEIAQRFGISQSLVGKILNNKRWVHCASV